MPSIILPEHLANHVNGAVKLTFACSTLPEAINYLANTYPDLYSVLFNNTGELNGFVNVYLNSLPVTHRLKDEIPIAEHDCLEIVTSVSGG